MVTTFPDGQMAAFLFINILGTMSGHDLKDYMNVKMYNYQFLDELGGNFCTNRLNMTEYVLRLGDIL